MGNDKTIKNVFIYINPSKSFSPPDEGWKGECDVLAKIAIDNSLALGWKREDIIVVTNFPYEYNGIKSLWVSDDNYCEFSPTASKINVILTLFDKGLIGKDLYWFHDWDVFQLEPITAEEVNLKKGCIGLTDYGVTTMRNKEFFRWSTGTLFFRDDTRETFQLLKDAVYKYKANEEVALLALRRKHPEILDRLQTIDITYNVATRKRDVIATYEKAQKPLKVIHFHPFDRRSVRGADNNMDMCVYGKNSINKVLVNQTIIDLFKKYEIQ
jgi:hypothetical protein